MDFINHLVALFLAIVPAHQALNLIISVPVIVLAIEFTRALKFLARDFIRCHRLITLDIIATGAGHTTYALWAHSGEASVMLGIFVLMGYCLALIGLAQAFIQGQGPAPQYP